MTQAIPSNNRRPQGETIFLHDPGVQFFHGFSHVQRRKHDLSFFTTIIYTTEKIASQLPRLLTGFILVYRFSFRFTAGCSLFCFPGRPSQPAGHFEWKSTFSFFPTRCWEGLPLIKSGKAYGRFHFRQSRQQEVTWCKFAMVHYCLIF